MQVLGLKPGLAPWGNPSLSNSNKENEGYGVNEDLHKIINMEKRKGKK
jgi:hypothetical protein